MSRISFGLPRDAVEGEGTTGGYSAELSGSYPISWVKHQGESVQKGEEIAFVELEKVQVSVSAPAGGRIAEVFESAEWSRSATKEVIETPCGAILAPPLGEIETEEKEDGENEKEYRERAERDLPGLIQKVMDAARKNFPPEIMGAIHETAEMGTALNRATPLARKMAERQGVDVSSLRGTGIGGKVSSIDVEKVSCDIVSKSIRAVPAARAFAQERGIDIKDMRGTGDDGLVLLRDVEGAVETPSEKTPPLMETPQHEQARPDLFVRALFEERPASSARKTIARLLARSKAEIVSAGDAVPVDVTVLREFHKEYAPTWQRVTGEKLRYDHYFMFFGALLFADPRFSVLNGYWDKERQVAMRARQVNIGFALHAEREVAEDGYLVIPVIHRAETLLFRDLVHAVEEKIKKMRAGKLSLSDTRDLTVTWNNTGVLGGVAPESVIPYAVSNSGIEYPTGFIFNVTAFEERERRTRAKIAFRFDHRLTDGKQASAFARELKGIVEAPQDPEEFWSVFVPEGKHTLSE